jgi:hypothetical protein
MGLVEQIIILVLIFSLSYTLSSSIDRYFQTGLNDESLIEQKSFATELFQQLQLPAGSVTVCYSDLSKEIWISKLMCLSQVQT